MNDLTELERQLRHLLDEKAAIVTTVLAPPDLERQIAQRQRRYRLRVTAVTGTAAAAALVVVVLTAWTGLVGWHRGPDAATDPKPHPRPVRTAELIPEAPIPGRREAGAVWDGREYLVWGGYREDVPGVRVQRADGAAFDPVTSRWRVLPAAPIVARSNPIMYWTGREAVVWGGDGDRGEIPDGAAYDPATERWRRIPAAHGQDWRPDFWASHGSHLFVAHSGELNRATGKFEYRTSTVTHFDAATNRWSSFRASGWVAGLQPYRDGVVLLERTSGRYQVAYVSRNGVRRDVVALPGSLAVDGIPHGEASVTPGTHHLTVSGGDVTVNLTAQSAPIFDGTTTGGYRKTGLRLWHLKVDGAGRLTVRDGPMSVKPAEGTLPLLHGGEVFGIPDRPTQVVLLDRDELAIFDLADGRVVMRFEPPATGWPRSACNLGDAAYASSGDTVLMWSGVECVMGVPTSAGLLWHPSR